MTPAQLKALQWAVNRACSKAARRDAIENDKGALYMRQMKAARAALTQAVYEHEQLMSPPPLPPGA